MTQHHAIQRGTFHVTTNTREGIPWCTLPEIPQLLMDNLVMTKNIQCAQVFAFCVLPNHIHILLEPGERGLSAFMHSFKRNSSWHIRQIYSSIADNIKIIPVAGVHEPQLRDVVLKKSWAPVANTGDIRWQNGFHDERIRDTEQLSNALSYVQYNAWHHHLTEEPEGWPWSSLWYEQFLDPMEIWLD
ncbi:hypothetical protein COU80_01305 [Candidatus Peregrinibacteria bacterium CG10_big_fil_rev_8_21_14_0_10_55_24]|nr:MAG: hypothetical protein COU80_01305 [Candidatus Peregrinibacteria bacterium CG10_big_fil_rev_8_21_14_0_10_55_24]